MMTRVNAKLAVMAREEAEEQTLSLSLITGLKFHRRRWYGPQEIIIIILEMRLTPHTDHHNPQTTYCAIREAMQLNDRERPKLEPGTRPRGAAYGDNLARAA